MGATFAFKPAARGVKGLDPAVVQAEFERLEKLHGKLAPETLVTAARPVGSALHDAFTWEDSLAAERWRLQEASYLLRVVVIEPEGGFTATRAVVHIEETPEGGVVPAASIGAATGAGGYRSLEVVMSSPEMRDQMLHRALIDFRVWRGKYAALKELAPIFDAADEITKKHKLD